MKPVLIAGTTIVNIALVSYTIFIINERKTGKAGKNILTFLTLGVILDMTSTICMIIGSSRGPFTIHGILGYSSLTGMLIDAFLLWRHKIKSGPEIKLSKALHTYSLAAYLWWLMAYITGAMIVAFR